jgi:integrase
MKRTHRGDGMLYRRPGTALWWFAIADGKSKGGMLRESTGQTDKKLAQKVLDAKRDQIAAARGGYTTLPGPEDKKTTVHMLLAALLQDFELRKVRSLNSIKSYVGHVERAFGAWKVIDLTEGAIKHYKADRDKAGHAASSINHSLQVLGQAIRPFLTKRGLPVPEIHKLPEHNVREGFYSKGDVERLVPGLPEDLRDFFRWGFLTGWRKGAIASLKWADVDRETGSIRLSWRHAKNGKAQSLALVGELADIIERRWQARTITLKSGATLISPLVFHRGAGAGKHLGAARPVADFDKALKRACEAAGIVYGRFGGRTFHCTRRSAARELRNAHQPESVIMKIGGWRTREIFDRYNIVDESDTAEAMLALQAHQAQATPSNVIPLRAATAAR